MPNTASVLGSSGRGFLLRELDPDANQDVLRDVKLPKFCDFVCYSLMRMDL
jgi:hypothetical protein